MSAQPSMQEKIYELASAAQNNCLEHGGAIVEKSEEAAKDILIWIQHIEGGQLTGVANCLVAGTRSAIRESAACLCLGLARPALGSIRLEMDLILSWLYFKDHPAEWARVGETGDGYKLKTDILKYLSEMHPRFNERFGILKECMTRHVVDPYRLLSAHIHGQSEYVLPDIKEPRDIVSAIAVQAEVADLQGECAEYIGDILWSVYADRWAAIPSALRAKLIARFKTEKQKTTFFG